jgi:DNA (cytosine-5)-methyltransferase 3A
MKPLNVLSLFDGMSCGRLALDRLGVPINMYCASEIDKYAIQIARKNYLDTVHLGDVCKVDSEGMPVIDLLLAGSPCQGFSFAGKQLAFDDPRSKLFFEFVRILKEFKVLNPEIKFLLENVKMKKEYQDVISGVLGVEPIEINSALVSAQNRKRLYWTNIVGVVQPEDLGILLKDIIISGLVDRDKSYCLDASYYKGGNLKQYFEKCRRQLVFELLDVGVAKNKKGIFVDPKSPNPCTFYETRTEEGKQARRELSKKLGRDTTPRDAKSKMYRFQPHGKANCLVTVDSFLNYIIDDRYYIRKLTPIECERLQTAPDNYTDGVSNTQRYKMLGNGWTIDVIAHILSFMQ